MKKQNLPLANCCYRFPGRMFVSVPRLAQRPLPLIAGERASRLFKMATGRSSSRRHIARGDPGGLLGDALELAKCPGADRLYLRDRSACGRRHSDRNRV